MTTPTATLLRFEGSGKAYIENDSLDSFSCGTVHGTWHLYEGFREHPNTPVIAIVDVYNDERKNGDFRQFLEQLFPYCLNQGRDVMAMDVAGYLVDNLIQKYGFEKLPASTHLLRRCYSASPSQA